MHLQPFILTPAFRSGSSTPWGGSLLQSLYGKKIPNAHTGESLEMSLIPGLESRNAAGVTLSSLAERHGEALTGLPRGAAFPLLLKLIDAQQQLSVQVHPDDAYAARHENKLGKTEAWVILQAEPGAQLVYGIREGVSKEQLRRACETGTQLKSLLRFVSVKAGDVFYIPAGMVHAIGAGIVLYEIQQSSDVTYRFYDWDRTDAQGAKRELHIRQALDVVRTDLQLSPAAAKPLADDCCQRELLLDTPYFSLQRLRFCKSVPFFSKARFSVLTALEAGSILMRESGCEIPLLAGQTLFIPAQTEPFLLTCDHCLLSSPGYSQSSTT